MDTQINLENFERDLFRASIQSLAKEWESEEDEKVWSHLQ